MNGQDFVNALERAIEVAPVATCYEVVLWNQNEQTLLGRFEERETAEQHREAVIDAVMAIRRRAA